MVGYIKVSLLGVFVGTVLGCTIHLIDKFDKDSQKLKNAHKPVMIMGDH